MVGALPSARFLIHSGHGPWICSKGTGTWGWVGLGWSRDGVRVGLGWGWGDLHGFQLAQQGASGFWDVGGQVLVARLGSLAPLLQIPHFPL